MIDLFEVTETNTRFSNKHPQTVETDNKVLYLKLIVDRCNYLILLSDFVELKNTNLITPVQSHSLIKQNIAGTFYYQHQIIPVYKLKIKRENKGVTIALDNTKTDLELKKYYNLLLVRQDDYVGCLIAGHTHSEIIDINFARSRDNSENFEVLDIKRIINNL